MQENPQQYPPGYSPSRPQCPPPNGGEPWSQPTQWSTQPRWRPQPQPYVRRGFDSSEVRVRPPVQPRLSRGEALARIRGLKFVAMALSIVGFGTLGALAAERNADASSNVGSGSSIAPDQNPDSNGGGFFNNNGGFGFGSGSSQRPSAGTGVS